MKIKDLKKFIDSLPEDSEIVVYSDSSSRSYKPTGISVGQLGSCYFGGGLDDYEEDLSTDHCLILDIY
jgi:hypothetical protein